MPVSKKPRKKSSGPRLLLRPLHLRDHMKGDMKLQVAWQALGTDWFLAGHLSQLIIHGEVVRDAGNPEMRPRADRLLEICESIRERHERLDRFGVNGDEMRDLNEILKITAPYVRTIPNNIIHRIITNNRKKRGLT